MKITRDILIQENIDISAQKLCIYWEDRGMKFVERSETYFKGKRGNLLGNLLSFNMKHIISQIEIRKKSHQIECNLSVNTILQYMTESNQNFFKLELETFEKYLLSGDLNKKSWVKLHKKSKQQDILFILICFLTSLITIVLTTLLF